MKSMNYRSAVMAFAVLALLLTNCASQPPRRPIGPELHGAWENLSSKSAFELSNDGILYREGDTTVVVKILEADGEVLTVRKYGAREIWRFDVVDGELTQRVGDRATAFRRSSSTLSTEPVRVPSPREIPESRVSEIQAEIAALVATDQAVLKNPARRGEFRELARANKSALLRLINEVGWIDASRFGGKTSSDAILISKHSGDLGLLRAILPLVQKDFGRQGDGAQSFSITYDDVQLKLGERQRYGSQVCRNASGEPFVCALEKPSEVDLRRASLGLEPLQSYLEQVSKLLFNGKPVRIPADGDEQ